MPFSRFHHPLIWGAVRAEVLRVIGDGTLRLEQRYMYRPPALLLSTHSLPNSVSSLLFPCPPSLISFLPFVNGFLELSCSRVNLVASLTTSRNTQTTDSLTTQSSRRNLLGAVQPLHRAVRTRHPGAWYVRSPQISPGTQWSLHAYETTTKLMALVRDRAM